MRSQDIYEHQIKTLVSLVQRWHKSGGLDASLERKVREFVSFELMGRGSADVIARAMGELNDPEADRLNDMLNHCSQNFYQMDVVWRAFAVPVAVCWHMKPHRIYTAKRGDQEYLKELAAGIRQCTGAQAVYLDPAIYSAKSLFNIQAHKLFLRLQGLVIGAPNARLVMPALPNMALRSSSEPPWRMAYFLGVEVQALNARSQIDDPGVQEAMQSYLHFGTKALTVPKTPLFDLGARGETVCHMPLYLHDAILFGENAIRSYRLRQMLQEISLEEKSVTLYYAFNSEKYAVEILLNGTWLAFEMRWMLFSGETMDEFLHDVQRAVDATNKLVDCTLTCTDWEELENLRDQSDVKLCRFQKR